MVWGCDIPSVPPIAILETLLQRVLLLDQTEKSDSSRGRSGLNGEERGLNREETDRVEVGKEPVLVAVAQLIYYPLPSLDSPA